MNKLQLAEQALINEDIPEFRAGDRVNVHYRVSEGDKERIQKFEGDVISRQGSGSNQTFMVRKISVGNIGVERIFPLNSPYIAKIEVVREGDVSRSKLYYMRERSGKAARIKEKDTRVQEEAQPQEETQQTEEDTQGEESVEGTAEDQVEKDEQVEAEEQEESEAQVETEDHKKAVGDDEEE